jgi:hypothetical protein
MLEKALSCSETWELTRKNRGTTVIVVLDLAYLRSRNSPLELV